MNRLLVYLGRLTLILFGFIFAALGASAFLHVLILGALPFTGEELAFAAGGLIVSVPFLALIVGNIGFLPAMIAILIAEFIGRCDWLYFALAGGACGLAASWLTSFHTEFDHSLDPTTATLALGATGMVGGLCYWLVAGRSSGAWIEGAIDKG